MNKFILYLKNQKELTLKLKQGNRVIDHEDLTINSNLDTLLISSIDKILVRNNIDRLSLKSMEIQGKLRLESVSGMVLGTIEKALKI